MSATFVLYRVTVHVDEEVRDDWVTWMSDVHIPDVLREPGFEDAVVLRDTSDASRFVIEYRVRDREALERYFAGSADRLRAEHTARYAGRARASREVFELVAERRGAGR
jgi:hypothetical protein